MATTLYVTPIALFAVVLSVNVGMCCGGLKNQRNFAHVYGKRASQQLYDERQKEENDQKVPLFPKDIAVDYVLDDDNFFFTRGEPKAKTKANVAHMFGRELYDKYPRYDDLEMYNDPDSQDDGDVFALPTNRDDLMIQIPESKLGAQNNAIQRHKRFPLRDILGPSKAVRMEALAYLDNIIRITSAESRWMVCAPARRMKEPTYPEGFFRCYNTKNQSAENTGVLTAAGNQRPK